MRQLEERCLKIFGIIWCASITYSIAHHYINQTDFATFPSMFNAYLRIYLQNYPQEFISDAAKHAIETGESFPFLLYISLFLHFVAGIEPRTILLMPIGSILIPISYIIVNKSFFKNYNFLCILLTIYFIIYFLSTKTFRGSYMGAFALPEFITLIYCLKKIYENKNIPKFSLISIMIISFLVGLWHTMAFTGVIFTIILIYFSYAMNFVVNKYKISSCEKFQVRQTLAILSFILLVFFKLDDLSPYIEMFLKSNNELYNILEPFIRNLAGKPTLFMENHYQYNYIDGTWGKLYFISNLGVHILSTFMLVYGIVISIKLIRSVQDEMKNLQLGILFGITGIVSQVIISMLYSKTGTGLFYVIYLFPILGIYLLNNLKKEKLVYFCLIILTCLALVFTFSSHVTGENERTPVTKYEDLESSFLWTYKYININYPIYADFNTLYSYVAYESQKNAPIIKYKDIDERNYGFIVGDSNSDNVNKSYVTIDYATMIANKPINIYKARGLLTPELDRINSNKLINKVYIDQNIAIYTLK